MIKKLSILLTILFALGACMLTPLATPPPKLDPNSPEGKQLISELVNEVKDAGIKITVNGVEQDLDLDPETGDLKLPGAFVEDALGDELGDLFAPNSANGEDYEFDLHSITDKGNGIKHIVYLYGDTYVGAIYDEGPPVVLKIINTPLINYGDIDWSGDGDPVFEFTVPDETETS